MSGLMDKPVTAALLAEQGYDVVGVTLQLYDHGAAVGRKGACCAGQDIYDARRVAETVGIPHYVLDYESKFSQSVMDDFADSYLRGETPIPCVRCNQSVKFRDLLAVAKDLGAEVLATGHYVRRVMGPQGPELHRARDPGRDQSYFLFATTREQLDFCASRRWRSGESRKCARWPNVTICRSQPSPTARISASCPMAITPASSASCAPARSMPAISSIRPAMCSAVTKASSISPSASAVASISATGRARITNRFMSSSSMPRKSKWLSGQRKLWRKTAWRCARSTGLAMRRAMKSTSMCACAPPSRPCPRVSAWMSRQRAS